MSWLVLLASGALEAVWATALSRTAGFTRLVPTLVVAVALVASVGGLAVAMRSLPTGTAYAVWVGVGAALTVGWAMATGAEDVNVLKVVCLVGIVVSVVGLKVAH